MKRTKRAVLAGLVLMGLLFSGSTFAAKNAPVQLTADVIEYNANQKFIQAKGNVHITQETATLSGPYAEYRNETGIALLNGGIVMTNETIRVTGQQLEYNTDSGVGAVTGQPRLENKDGAWVTGDKIDFYAKENRAVFVGNVHAVYPGKQIDAVGDRATYYVKEQKIVLAGNARAVQGGNSLVGETLTVYINDRTMDAKGSTKLIIIPDDKK